MWIKELHFQLLKDCLHVGSAGQRQFRALI